MDELGKLTQDSQSRIMSGLVVIIYDTLHAKFSFFSLIKISFKRQEWKLMYVNLSMQYAYIWIWEKKVMASLKIKILMNVDIFPYWSCLLTGTE